MTVTFDGRKLAEEKLKALRPRVGAVKKKLGRPPKIVVLMVGENKASRIYVNEKKEVAEKAGIDFELAHFSSTATIEEVVEKIKEANDDQAVDGVMVQLPISLKPKAESQKPKEKILNSILPEKDVDCLTEENLELVRIGRHRYLPGTVKAVLEIAESQKLKAKSHLIVVVGDRGFVGRPLVWTLENQGFKVLGANSQTKNLAELTRKADILISAAGCPNLIKKAMVKDGVVVIDVGYPRADVDFGEVKSKTSFITPVPGGVGPMTVACLLENLVVAAERKLR